MLFYSMEKFCKDFCKINHFLSKRNEEIYQKSSFKEFYLKNINMFEFSNMNKIDKEIFKNTITTVSFSLNEPIFYSDEYFRNEMHRVLNKKLYLENKKDVSDLMKNIILFEALSENKKNLIENDFYFSVYVKIKKISNSIEDILVEENTKVLLNQKTNVYKIKKML